jgi:hypothetical protein
MWGQEESNRRHKDGAGVFDGDSAVPAVMSTVMVQQEAAAAGGEGAEEEAKPWNVVAAG